MTKPLALIHYNNLLPGSQLANRLYELGYRVQVVESAGLEELSKLAEQEKPFLFVAEISHKTQVCAAISKLKKNPATEHIPVLAFATNPDKALTDISKEAGASLLASSRAILDQLPQLLDQILSLE